MICCLFVLFILFIHILAYKPEVVLRRRLELEDAEIPATDYCVKPKSVLLQADLNAIHSEVSNTFWMFVNGAQCFESQCFAQKVLNLSKSQRMELPLIVCASLVHYANGTNGTNLRQVAGY